MKIFLTSQASIVLEKFLPDITADPSKANVLFITTAGNPYEKKPWQDDDRRKLMSLGFPVTDFDLDGKTEEEVAIMLNDHNIIFIAGGNTFYLLEKSKKCGFDCLVRGLVDSDKIYIGSSAGSCVAGPDLEAISPIDEPDRANLENTKAFGLVDFVVIPHFGREKYLPYHQKALERYGSKYKLITLKDDQYVVVKKDGFDLM